MWNLGLEFRVMGVYCIVYMYGIRVFKFSFEEKGEVSLIVVLLWL